MTATVVEVGIPATEFALSDSLSAIDELSCEVERVVAHDDDRIMPFVWITADEPRDTIESTLADDPSTEDIELLADLGDEWLYQMEWISKVELLVRVLVEEDGTILAAMGNEHEWNLRIVFPERDALSRTYQYCQDREMTLNVINIYQLEDGRKGRFGLSDEQQDTLTLAYDQGYYQIPRKAGATDLAEELDISHQAISERLRRGHESLVENALILGKGADDSNTN
ncbi:bacterio-opsin activator domain-containing protein [Haladaptatus sp. CMAA 1911]|uniref:helix-turn-helix domain-containing protein n=1 Tax=unclassified Haladaptatus TaxID=2622732 RepID=UPI0037550F98